MKRISQKKWDKMEFDVVRIVKYLAIQRDKADHDGHIQKRVHLNKELVRCFDLLVEMKRKRPTFNKVRQGV